MNANRLGILFVLIFAESTICALAQNARISPPELDPHNVHVKSVHYRDRDTVLVTDAEAQGQNDAERFAIVKGTSFEDGTIEISLTGDTVPDAPAQLRGFVGLAFRVSEDGSRFECFYLRPKNGRSEDQLQRNHSAQYISVPGFPWEKLRSETPGKYESYVDLVPGEWTKIRIRVDGTTAFLYVNGAAQPTLVVKDLKQTPAAGAIALWIGPGTIAHFSDLKISH